MEELILKLKEHKYLTTDSFGYPDKTYIYLDDNSKIKKMRSDGFVVDFDFEIYKNCNFRKVKIISNNFYNDLI